MTSAIHESGLRAAKAFVSFFLFCTLVIAATNANSAPVQKKQAANSSLSDKQIANTLLERAQAFHLSPANGIPLSCKVGFDIVYLVRIDEVKETYTIDFYSWIGWSDRRLAFDPREFGVDRINVSPTYVWAEDRMWNPFIEFMNLVDTKVTEESLRIESSGYCRLTMRQTATFKFAGGENEFRGFPFDEQELPVAIESFRWDRRSVNFSIDGGKREYSKADLKKLHSSEWIIEGARTMVSEPAYSGDPAPFSRATFTLLIKRHPGFYLWKVCLPIFVLVVVAMSVSWIPGKDIEARIVLSITTVVAITTYGIVINADLPKLSYLTSLDLWMLACFVLSSCGIIQNVVVSNRAHHGSPGTSRKIDVMCRWLMPLLFVLATIFCLLAR